MIRYLEVIGHKPCPNCNPVRMNLICTDNEYWFGCGLCKFETKHVDITNVDLIQYIITLPIDDPYVQSVQAGHIEDPPTLIPMCNNLVKAVFNIKVNHKPYISDNQLI